MAQCPNCGTTTSPDQAVCLVCGADLAVAAQGSATGASPVPPPGAKAGPPRKVSLPSIGKLVPFPAALVAILAKVSRPRSGKRAPFPAPLMAILAKVSRPRGRSLAPFPAALVAILVMELVIETFTGPGNYAFRLFRPSGGWLMAVVPSLTAFAFFWACADLFLKLRMTRVNEADLAHPEIVRLPTLVAQEPTGVTLDRLRSWDGRLLARPVGRRVHWLLQHLDTTDPGRAHELIRHQSDLEVDLAASGYRVVKLLIWAMPILGFIGTVLGISIAVGGFANFLTTTVSIDELGRVTAELGTVASGLSFAFDTTLVGLVGGLAASVLSTGVQSREEGVLTRLEEIGLRIIESATPAGASVASVAAVAGAPSEELEKVMHAKVQELSKQMDQFTAAMRVGLDGFLGEWAKLPPEVERAGADLVALHQHLTAAAKSTDQLIVETLVLLEALRETSAHMSGEFEASIGSVNATVEALGSDLQRVADSLSKSVDALGQRASAEEALRRLDSSIGELAARMDHLSATQASLAPVLSQLAQPLELRLVPSQPSRGQAD